MSGRVFQAREDSSRSRVTEVTGHGVLLEAEDTSVCLNIKYEQGENAFCLLEGLELDSEVQWHTDGFL